ASGKRKATLQVADSAANSPQTVALVGNGVRTSLSLTPSSLQFASQLINSNSKAQPVTLTNIGTAAVTITNIATTTLFTQTNNCPTSLAKDASCTISVVFRPNKPGVLTGALTASQGTKSVSASLTGVGTVVGFSPGNLAFGDQAMGTSS